MEAARYVEQRINPTPEQCSVSEAWTLRMGGPTTPDPVSQLEQSDSPQIPGPLYQGAAVQFIGLQEL